MRKDHIFIDITFHNFKQNRQNDGRDDFDSIPTYRI